MLGSTLSALGVTRRHFGRTGSHWEAPWVRLTGTGGQWRQSGSTGGHWGHSWVHRSAPASLGVPVPVLVPPTNPYYRFQLGVTGEVLQTTPISNTSIPLQTLSLLSSPPSPAVLGSPEVLRGVGDTRGHTLSGMTQVTPPSYRCQGATGNTVTWRRGGREAMTLSSRM